MNIIYMNGDFSRISIENLHFYINGLIDNYMDKSDPSLKYKLYALTLEAEKYYLGVHNGLKLIVDGKAEIVREKVNLGDGCNFKIDYEAEYKKVMKEIQKITNKVFANKIHEKIAVYYSFFFN